jgi:hypothetical protein
MRFLDQRPPDEAKLAAAYERRGLSDPAYRAKVEASLIRGWEIENTPSYILVTNTGNRPFLRKIESELEILRAELTEVFPPREGLESVSTVRVCHDASEYTAYGGPPGTGGFFSPTLRELVLFDNARRDGLDWGNEDTRRVLYHEAFHQYIYDAVGRLSPHMWFNEGMGEYFAGARILKGEVACIEPVASRLGRVQYALTKGGGTIPWREILRYDQETFYAADRVSLTYAQAWSMVYFLETAPAAQEREEWRAILPVYFDTLQARFADELLLLEHGGEPEGDAEELIEEARERSRRLALEAAFDGVDLPSLERAWKDFVLSL